MPTTNFKESNLILKTNLILKILYVFAVFLTGFAVSEIISYSPAVERPFSFSTFSTLGTGHSVSAPSSLLSNEDIRIYKDRVVILIDNATLSSYDSTGSMLPVLDKGAKGIRIVPKSEEEINVGDIVSFRRGNDLIIHRVVEKGFDEKGTYFVTKGDNSPHTDGKIRFNQIEYKTIAIIY